MNINVEFEAETKDKLINHILNGNFYGENFYRYSIEISKGNNLIATRLVRDMDNERFAIAFVKQEDLNGSWEDIESEDYIKFVEGDINNIYNIITYDVFNSIIPTMIMLLVQ